MSDIKAKVKSFRCKYYDVQCYCAHCGEMVKLTVPDEYCHREHDCSCGAKIETYLDDSYMVIEFIKSDEFKIKTKLEKPHD